MGGFGFQLVASIVIFFFVVVAAVIVFAIIKAVTAKAKDAAAPEVSAVARVTDKRIETRGGGDTMVSQVHFVTFEQPGGERFELTVPASDYGLLVVGDQGTVSMKGSHFLGFQRELLR